MATPTPVKYGKSIALTLSDGTTKTLTGSQALAAQKFLDDHAGLLKIVTSETTGAKEFYALNYSGCGFCKVATLTPSAAATSPVACEDGMPNCPGDNDPTTPSISVSENLVQVEVGKDVTVTADVVPATDTVTWASKDTATATVAAGKITGVKAGNTTVTATSSTGNKVATITVMVFPDGTFNNPTTGGSTANK